MRWREFFALLAAATALPQTTRSQAQKRVAVALPAHRRVHVHFPGLAHVVRRGESYDLIPEAWSPVL